MDMMGLWEAWRCLCVAGVTLAVAAAGLTALIWSLASAVRCAKEFQEYRDNRQEYMRWVREKRRKRRETPEEKEQRLVDSLAELQEERMRTEEGYVPMGIFREVHP